MMGISLTKIAYNKKYVHIFVHALWMTKKYKH